MRLICADAYEWLKTAEDKSVDHVITDFVYGTQFPLWELLRVAKGNVITFCSDKDNLPEPDERAYWIKTPSTKNYSKHLGRFVEHIFIYRQGNVFNKPLSLTSAPSDEGTHWSQYTGVYTDLVEEPNGHQWQKPMSLIERLVKIYTLAGDRILDPFCGSGTTLRAAARHGRDSIGIDINAEWIEYCKKL